MIVFAIETIAGGTIMHDLFILALVWIGVLFSSLLADKTRLTPVLWYLFFGALLTNLGVLPVDMPLFIIELAELGIIVIMFALGFEEDTNNFLTSIKRSWGIAFFGALTPFVVAYSITLWFWNSADIALMCGLAMTATAVSLTMVSLKSEGLSQTVAATGIMTSAVIDDIASLALVALVVPIAVGTATLSMQGLLIILAKVIAFFTVVTFLGASLFPASKGIAARIPVIGQFSLKQMLSIGNGEYAILSLLLIAVLMGLLAHAFGFHPAVGAYMAGLIIRQEYFSRGDKNHFKQARMMIDNVAFSWLGPVFFVVLGGRLIFDGPLFITALPQALLLFSGLFVGQILSAAWAARFTGSFSWSESWLIGFGMLGRAELAFVVMEIAYVQYQLLHAEAFYTLMITCFLLNLSVPLTIRYWKRRHQQ
jgi:Kef-type K+ transport system membrane component KefB